MSEFFSGCVVLFNMAFAALSNIPFFRFLLVVVIFFLTLGLFLRLYHGSRRL